MVVAVEKIGLSNEVKKKIKEIIKIKSTGKEKEQIDRIGLLDDYIGEFLESKDKPDAREHKGMLELDRIILDIVTEQ